MKLTRLGFGGLLSEIILARIILTSAGEIPTTITHQTDCAKVIGAGLCGMRLGRWGQGT